PLPSGGGEPYTIHHGQGYSRWRHQRMGIHSDLCAFVPLDVPVKVYHLTLQNMSARRRQVSVTLYVEWVLGDVASRHTLHLVTRPSLGTGGLVATTAFRPVYGSRIAYLDLSGGTPQTVPADRAEFLGRNGTLTHPAAMRREALSGRTGATLDPCAAVRLQ